MGYYDYSGYFSTLINNQNIILNTLGETLLYLQVFTFIFTIFFVWLFISRMTKRRD